ncbi:Phage P22-like portal protein [Bartonella apihabitans]
MQENETLEHGSSTQFDSAKRDILFQSLLKLFRQDMAHVAEWRKNAREDYAFYNGEQWEAQDKAALFEQKRPVMTFNRIAPLVNAVIGSERNNKREVQFIPREIGDARANEILTGAAEWFRDQAEAEYEDSEAFTDTVICGMGWTDTRLDFDDDEAGKPVVCRLDPLKMVWDASAVKANLVDADRLWYIDEKPLAEARRMFPDIDPSLLDARWAKNGVFDSSAPLSHVNSDTFYGDDQTGASDADENDLGLSSAASSLVTLVECRWFEREAFYKVFDPLTGETQDYSLRDYEEKKKISPEIQSVRLTRKIVKRAFLGEVLLAEPDQPMVPNGQLGWECITGYFDKMKKHYYGIVRPTKDPQRWANKFFSQVMYLLNSQSKGGILAERGAFDDDRQAEESWARADAITWTKQNALAGQNARIQPKPVAQFPVGFFQLFNEAKEAISDVTGLSSEFIGTREVNQPGVLESQRRQSSLNLLASLFDALRRYRKRQGQIMLYLIQNYLSDGRLIRIVGDDNKKYVPLTHEAVANRQYDIIVDDAPTSPNEKERTFAIIQQMLPMLKDYLTPEIGLEILRYSPLPASLVEKWTAKAQEAAQQKAEQEMAREQMAREQMARKQMTSQEAAMERNAVPEQSIGQQADQLKLQALANELDMKAKARELDLNAKAADLFLKNQKARLETETAKNRALIEQLKIEQSQTGRANS